MLEGFKKKCSWLNPLNPTCKTDISTPSVALPFVGCPLREASQRDEKGSRQSGEWSQPEGGQSTKHQAHHTWVMRIVKTDRLPFEKLKLHSDFLSASWLHWNFFQTQLLVICVVLAFNAETSPKVDLINLTKKIGGPNPGRCSLPHKDM